MLLGLRAHLLSTAEDVGAAHLGQLGVAVQLALGLGLLVLRSHHDASECTVDTRLLSTCGVIELFPHI